MAPAPTYAEPPSSTPCTGVIFMTTSEPTLTHLCHSKSSFTLGFTLVVVHSTGFIFNCKLQNDNDKNKLFPQNVMVNVLKKHEWFTTELAQSPLNRFIQKIYPTPSIRFVLETLQKCVLRWVKNKLIEKDRISWLFPVAYLNHCKSSRTIQVLFEDIIEDELT